uniref:Uncharacterized protein n=1 Tax=Aegilops tauschii subsp. strangulata TaxID=200361 RepID=A0A453HJ69_AEGTS
TPLSLMTSFSRNHLLLRTRMPVCALLVNFRHKPPIRPLNLIALSHLVSLKYQEAVQNTAQVIVHCTICKNIFLSQTHHGSLAGSSVSEEKIASSVNKRRRSGTAKANDTSTNIGRTEKHSDSSSALGVADSIKDFEDLLAQSSRVCGSYFTICTACHVYRNLNISGNFTPFLTANAGSCT